ncbi:hypothetical protein TNIN_478411 [Trichonephila inaurata madagascariensis]|uniref:Uncharacterized protein n=1 Tax=Trichonephila inaurata madagascariensis TaxID=2747483 RepID=A0A8X6XTW4_9ARAC|nr:hypothetical protein TNIN_478411 [Trichonephila inaurata madagascariensis]
MKAFPPHRKVARGKYASARITQHKPRHIKSKARGKKRIGGSKALPVITIIWQGDPPGKSVFCSCKERRKFHPPPSTQQELHQSETPVRVQTSAVQRKSRPHRSLGEERNRNVLSLLRHEEFKNRESIQSGQVQAQSQESCPPSITRAAEVRLVPSRSFCLKVSSPPITRAGTEESIQSDPDNIRPVFLPPVDHEELQRRKYQYGPDGAPRKPRPVGHEERSRGKTRLVQTSSSLKVVPRPSRGVATEERSTLDLCVHNVPVPARHEELQQAPVRSHKLPPRSSQKIAVVQLEEPSTMAAYNVQEPLCSAKLNRSH